MDEVIRFIQIDYLHKYCLYYFVYLARLFSERPDDIPRKTRSWWSHISGLSLGIESSHSWVISFLSHLIHCSRATMTPRLARAREQLETVYHLNRMELNFLDKWNCTFFPLRKRDRLNRIIWSEFSDASGPGSGFISCQQETWWLNFLLCLTFYWRAQKIVVVVVLFCFFGEEGNNFFFRLLQHLHFVRETSHHHPHFSHDVAQTEARRNPESCK